MARYEYDAWGNDTKSETQGIAAVNPFGYAGYMYDKEIAMYYLIARYYNPTHAVYLSVDPDSRDADDPVTPNGYTYGDNNPVMLVDPDGHWVWLVVNAGFAAYEGYKAYKSGADWKGVTKAAVSGAFGGGKIKGAKYALGASGVFKGAGNIGRLGKQPRLRELANDDKISSALRGEIRRDINQIKRGKRKNIRVPKGYELAHRRGFEARSGYGYQYSDLQLIKNHKLQHKYDGYGRKRKR